MKDWFPFTDYDFYAYLVSGGSVLAAADYLFNGGAIVFSSNLTIMQGILLIALSYVLGSIIAGFASTLVEHGLLRGIFIPPSEIQLGLRHARFPEKALAFLSAQFEYRPLPHAICDQLLTGVDSGMSVRDKAESAFFVAHAKAMTIDVSQKRLGSFQNQYGLYRNLTLTFLVVLGMTLFSNDMKYSDLIFWSSLGASVLMFLRFVKYYAAFSKEVFRAGR